jgi:hypothetical protein
VKVKVYREMYRVRKESKLRRRGQPHLLPQNVTTQGRRDPFKRR